MSKLRNTKLLWIREAESLTLDQIFSHFSDARSYRGLNFKHFTMMVQKCKELRVFLDEGFTLTDIRYWLVMHHTTPKHVICQGCNVVELHATSATSMPKTCGSKECISKVMVSSLERTCLKIYGVKHMWADKTVQSKCNAKKLELYGNLNNLQKAIETNRRNHGVDYSWQIPEVKEKSRASNLERLGCEYAMQSEEVKAKAKATVKKNVEENPDYYHDREQKSRQTKIANGHSPTWNNPEKREKTFIKNYGASNNMKTERGQGEYRKAIKKKYGKDYFVQTDEFQISHSRNYKNKTGYSHQSQNPEVQSKMKRKYQFDSRTFDSLPEIAFYIWLKDNNIEFVYQPSVSFEYEFDGKKFRYFPDFKIGDKLYELKGDHFFKEDGSMFLPYRKKSWSDEQYEWMCKKYEAKHQCMITNGIVVLKNDDFQQYVTYVNVKYGKDYLKSFRKNSQKSKDKVKQSSYDKAKNNN